MVLGIAESGVADTSREGFVIESLTPDETNSANINTIFKTRTAGSVTQHILLEGNGKGTTFAGNLTIPEYIYHSGDTNSYFGWSDNDHYILRTAGSTKIFADASNTYLYFEGSQKLRTINTGILVTGGISASATSSISCDGATKALGVSNVGTTSDPTMEIKTSGTASGASSLDIYQVNTIYGPSAIQFFYGSTSSTAVGSIRAASSSTTYNTSSDYRLKENITDLSNALERVDNLEPKRFNFKNTPDVVVDGFLAHEAQEVVPQAVSGEKDAEIDGKPSYQGIDHSMIVPLLTAAIKELKAQNEELLARIEALENN